MTAIRDALFTALARKREIDDMTAGGVGWAGGEGKYTATQRWLVSAVETLLQAELDRNRPHFMPLIGEGFSEGEDAERRGEVPVMRGDEHGR